MNGHTSTYSARVAIQMLRDGGQSLAKELSNVGAAFSDITDEIERDGGLVGFTEAQFAAALREAVDEQTIHHNRMAVRHPRDLFSLAAVLNSLAYSERYRAAREAGRDPWVDDEIDLAELPKFGGEAPLERPGAFSWNEHSLLVPDDGHGWRIVSR